MCKYLPLPQIHTKIINRPLKSCFYSKICPLVFQLFFLNIYKWSYNLWQFNSQVTKHKPQQPATQTVRTSYSKEGGKRLFWMPAVIWSNSSWECSQNPTMLATRGWQTLSIKVIDKLFAIFSNCFPQPLSFISILPTQPLMAVHNPALSIKQSISSAGLKVLDV